MLAIADELTENGFVLRCRTGETDDGLSGKEGTSAICSFWREPIRDSESELRMAMMAPLLSRHHRTCHSG